MHGPLFPLARPLPFGGFNNKYASQTCYVVGRGPTDFNYANLADVTDPIFFINDAVSLENYARSETFFFAHDVEMRIWLDGSIRATCVLPIDGTVLANASDVCLGHRGPIVCYRRGEQGQDKLLRMSRDELAGQEELYVNSGTMHSLLHFVWYCGFSRVMFVGCDGINHKTALNRNCKSEDGYDRRLPNRSSTQPAWQYHTIRRAQNLLTQLFGLEAVYLGTPVLRLGMERDSALQAA